jgi:hypothetical protein
MYEMGAPGSSPSTMTSAATIELLMNQLLEARESFASNHRTTSLVRPAQPVTQLLPPPLHQRLVHRNSRVPATPSGPASSTHGVFFLPWVCGDKVSENSYFLSSLLSQRRDFPWHSEAAMSGGSTEESSTLIL